MGQQQHSSRQLVLGTTSGKRQIALSGADAAQHIHCMGITGMGKSKLLASLFLQLLNQHVGVCLLDPHGDLADDILQTLAASGYFVHPAGYERLLYCDFSRQDRYLPFNILAHARESHTIARDLWEAWNRAWGGLAGGNAPMMEQAVLAGTYVLTENHRPLTDLHRLYSDAAFRQTLLARIRDPQVASFFATHFDSTGRRGGQLAESALRRAFLLTFSPALRWTLGQTGNALPFRQLMDRGVSVICNLSGLDAETQRFLGCLVSVGVEQAALSRADIPADRRLPYNLILDEFSLFSAQSELAMERILALARKYGLSLTVAHQTWGQARALQSALQNACFVTFRLGLEDAPWGAARVGTIDLHRLKASAATGRPVAVSAGEQRLEWEQRLLTLPPRHAVLRLGKRTEELLTLGIPEPRCSAAQLTAIKQRYAERYMTPLEQIEREMAAADTTHSNAPYGDESLGGRTGTVRVRAQQAPSPALQQPRQQVPQPGSNTPPAGGRRRSPWHRVRRRVISTHEGDPEDTVEDEGF